MSKENVNHHFKLCLISISYGIRSKHALFITDTLSINKTIKYDTWQKSHKIDFVTVSCGVKKIISRRISVKQFLHLNRKAKHKKNKLLIKFHVINKKDKKAVNTKIIQLNMHNFKYYTRGGSHGTI